MAPETSQGCQPTQLPPRTHDNDPSAPFPITGAFNARVKSSILHFIQPFSSAEEKTTTSKFLLDIFFVEQVSEYHVKVEIYSANESGTSCCGWFKHLANQFSIRAAYFPSTVASIIAPPATLVSWILKSNPLFTTWKSNAMQKLWKNPGWWLSHILILSA